jgi:hypothetical protein
MHETELLYLNSGVRRLVHSKQFPALRVRSHLAIPQTRCIQLHSPWHLLGSCWELLSWLTNSSLLQHTAPRMLSADSQNHQSGPSQSQMSQRPPSQRTSLRYILILSFRPYPGSSPPPRGYRVITVLQRDTQAIEISYKSCRNSNIMGTGGPFPGVKARPGRDADHSPPIYCRGREWVGAIPPLPPSASMACRGTALLFTIVSFLLYRFNWNKIRTHLLVSTIDTEQSTQLSRASVWYTKLARKMVLAK